MLNWLMGWYKNRVPQMSNVKLPSVENSIEFEEALSSLYTTGRDYMVLAEYVHKLIKPALKSELI